MLSSRSMLNNIIDRIKLPFRKDRELISSLYDIIGFYPHKMAYYKLALMHKSVGHRSTVEDITDDVKGKYTAKLKERFSKGDKKQNRKSGLGKKLNNERLEFLGDAILDAVVGHIVYSHYPGKPEGFLTNTRSKLVQRETLGKLAKEVGLSRLILSSGRSASHNSYMDGNAFEALVGAIYLDRGYDACMQFMQERILGRYINIDRMAYKEVNFKSKLIEWSQKNRIQLDFRLEDQSKDNSGSPTFSYTVVLEGIDGESGTGFSKKESQQHASEKTLKKLKHDAKFLDSVFKAKTARTQMDEDPVLAVPEAERPANDDFIVKQATEVTDNAAEQPSEPVASPVQASPETDVTAEPSSKAEQTLAVEMDALDDVTMESKEMTREDIIEAAEKAAYEEAGK